MTIGLSSSLGLSNVIVTVTCPRVCIAQSVRLSAVTLME